jgi:hypothetical protein
MLEDLPLQFLREHLLWQSREEKDFTGTGDQLVGSRVLNAPPQ